MGPCTNLRSGRKRSGVLPGFCCLNSLGKVKMGLGVGELIELHDLQASVIIGNNINNDEHFVLRFHLDRGLHLASGLCG